MWQPSEADVLVQDYMQHEWSLVIAACEQCLRRLGCSFEQESRGQKCEPGYRDNPGQVVAKNPTKSSHESRGGSNLSRAELVELGIDSEAGCKRKRQHAEPWPLGHPRNHQRERGCYSKAERNFRIEKRVLMTTKEDDERCHQ